MIPRRFSAGESAKSDSAYVRQAAGARERAATNWVREDWFWAGAAGVDRLIN